MGLSTLYVVVGLLARRERRLHSQDDRNPHIPVATKRATMLAVIPATASTASDVDLVVGGILLLFTVPWLANVGGLQHWWLRRARVHGNVDDAGRSPGRWRLAFGLACVLGLVLVAGGLAIR